MPHAHTPGPWIAGNASNGLIFSTWGVFAGGKRIATVKGGPDIANARLIAAAPSLKEAAHMALQALRHAPLEGPYGAKAKRALEVALAEAEGRKL